LFPKEMIYAAARRVTFFPPSVLLSIHSRIGADSTPAVHRTSGTLKVTPGGVMRRFSHQKTSQANRIAAHVVRALATVITFTSFAGCMSASTSATSSSQGSSTSATSTATAIVPTATNTPRPNFTPGPANVVITVLPSSYCTSHPNTCGNPPLKTDCSANSYPSFQLANIGGESTNFGIGEGDAIVGSGLPNYSPGFGMLAPGQIVVVVFSAPTFGPTKVLGYNVAIMWGQGHDPQYTVVCL
jgi:hypothetical protein